MSCYYSSLHNSYSMGCIQYHINCRNLHSFNSFHPLLIINIEAIIMVYLAIFKTWILDLARILAFLYSSHFTIIITTVCFKFTFDYLTFQIQNYLIRFDYCLNLISFAMLIDQDIQYHYWKNLMHFAMEAILVHLMDPHPKDLIDQEFHSFKLAFFISCCLQN